MISENVKLGKFLYAIDRGERVNQAQWETGAVNNSKLQPLITGAGGRIHMCPSFIYCLHSSLPPINPLKYSPEELPH